MKLGNSVPWPRLLAESVAIVGSILLAFAIDAWWEERKQRNYEEQVLLGLGKEYALHHSSVTLQIDFHESLMMSVTQLMRACSTGRYDDTEVSLDYAIFDSLVPVTTDLGSGVRDSLINAGQIDVLQNVELRRALSDWDSVVDEVVDGQLFSSELVKDHLLPFYKQYGVSLAAGEKHANKTPWPLPVTPLSAETLSDLFANRAYCTTLQFRYGHMSHTLDEYGYLLGAIEEIQALVELSQKARASS